jgi:hypothetical protein
MVRSTAISWKFGLAVTASALQLGQLPALADDRSAEQGETRPQPLEPKAVPVTLLPPASDTAVASWRQWRMDGAPTIMVRPAENAAIAQPRPEQLEAGRIMVQPAEDAATVQLRPEPEKIPEDVTRVETPLLPERRSPSVTNAMIPSPRLEPAKTQNEETLVAIPSLPGRSPFRQAPFKSEIVEEPAAFRQQAPEPALAKGSAASRFLANLWPSNKGASTAVSSTGEGSPSLAGDGQAGQAEAGAKSDTPPIKRFLDGIQFWKN